MQFSKLVEHVSKKPLPPHTKTLVVEVMSSDEEGEDVEVVVSLEAAVMERLKRGEVLALFESATESDSL